MADYDRPMYDKKKVVPYFFLRIIKVIFYYKLNNNMATTKTMKSSRTKGTSKTTVTTYVPVSDNIYHDGFSYRVRASVNGTKYSKNFSSKKKAVQYRNELLGK